MRFAGKRKDTNPITCEKPPPPPTRAEPLTQHMWKRVNKAGGERQARGTTAERKRGGEARGGKEPPD